VDVPHDVDEGVPWSAIVGETRAFIRDGLLDIYAAYHADPAFARLRAPGYRVVPGRGALIPRYVFVAEVPGAVEQRERTIRWRRISPR
jgi:hypothetical protein